MRRILLQLPLLLLAFLTTAQVQKDVVNAKNIAINWQIIENNHAGAGQFLSVLNIQNTSPIPLANKNWKLYFNFARRIIAKTVSGEVDLVHVNGDLYYFHPTAKFVPISNGASVNIEFASSDWAVNYTDAPEGFYLIYDNNPKKPIPITNVKAIPSTSPAQFARNKQDRVPAITPQLIYEENKNIVNLPEKELQKVFPTPVAYEKKSGAFILDGAVKITADPLFAVESIFLKEKLALLLTPKKTLPAGKSILLKLDKSLAKEGYAMEINQNNLTINAADPTGIFYGIQSLFSMLPPQKRGIKVASIHMQNAAIEDHPRFPFRGLMIDVARNFQTKEEIIKLLDLMGMYKLNVLHFHLNDDEGWRLEIQGLPELTELGSKRGHPLDSNANHLIPSFGSGPFVNNPHGTGHYSTADFIAILKHANARHIRVIPEIEAPGHARAAIRSMEARYHRLMKAGEPKAATEYLLQDLNDRSTYRSVQNWNDNVIDPALPSAYNFMEKVSDEIIAMYKAANAPLQTIHFGGDEVPDGAWEGSPTSLAFVKAHPELKDVNGLWAYFYNRLYEMLKQRNLYLSGWEEVGMQPVVTAGKKSYVINPGLADKNIHLNVWNNIIGWGAEDLAYRLANVGYKVILGGVSNFYFDMAYQKSFDEPGYYWGEYADIDKAFNFIPFNSFLNSNKDKFGNTLKEGFYDSKERLTAKGKANIVGLQGLLWSETIKGAKDLEYMIMPKLLGLAERAWATDPEWANEPDSIKRKQLYNRAWSEFVNVVGKRELPRIDAAFETLNYRLPPAGAVVKDGLVHLNIQFPGLTVRYTIDQTEPTKDSPVYTKPVPAKGLIRFRTFDSKGRGGKSSSILPDENWTRSPKQLP
ncbi:carbohydate-binding domain-containing protein [Pedobacter sp. PLR]|uniref:family 20 glycosylhydrolase n=1 Tax=Pedobacter sp. PLR TaxID=2994465 RepID=UPI0022461264|nr:family 20 glycosylhydrolase [Pedobacter sp. PLR]MCX2450984.1 carbohydate-binding domain-containing protein [Pedobacter sp. PLR]